MGPRIAAPRTTPGLNGGHSVRSFVIPDLRAMARAARAAGARLAVQSAYPKLFDAALDLRVLDARLRVRRRAPIQRSGGPQRAPARDDDRFPELRRLGSLELRGLGQFEGRGLAQAERLEVRLRDVLPEGQDDGHLLLVRAVALPLRRAHRRGEDPRQRPDPPRIPVASADGACPDTDAHADAHADADTDADAHADTDPDPDADADPDAHANADTDANVKQRAYHTAERRAELLARPRPRVDQTASQARYGSRNWSRNARECAVSARW